MNKIRFLIVDDDPIALEVVRERLEQLGFDVATRDQSLGTSRWILEHRPDFVLLDLMMPALTGGELANVLKRRAAHTWVILHSSKPDSELDALVEETGALGAVSKRLDERRFRHEVQRLVRTALITRADSAGGRP